jgi:hypothetical protein
MELVVNGGESRGMTSRVDGLRVCVYSIGYLFDCVDNGVL